MLFAWIIGIVFLLKAHGYTKSFPTRSASTSVISHRWSRMHNYRFNGYSETKVMRLLSSKTDITSSQDDLKLENDKQIELKGQSFSSLTGNAPLPESVINSSKLMRTLLSLGVDSLAKMSKILSRMSDGLSKWSASLNDKANPYEGGTVAYNVTKAEEFYQKRPWLVAGRLAKIISLTLPFQMSLLMDWKSGQLKANEHIRAKQALHMLGQLGPTFVKLGQAMSIRTDIIPHAYAAQLKHLQDSVPPFNNTLAKSIICKELNIQRLEDKFLTFSEFPVASASIGQVYKATLFNGREVAVKVQRPNILSDISLDLYLLRVLAPLQVFVMNLIQGEKTESKDVALVYSLVDEWGRGLVAEVDYRQEAKNTNDFIRAMHKRGLYAVTSPEVIEMGNNHLFSNRNSDNIGDNVDAGCHVLVTEWVTGTRLDRDVSPDVPRLCGVALNAYLTMLLDTGVLHCDPHPGNLLRTTDGRLCILDWGMTLDLPKDLQYSLLEFIAHINAEDFDRLPQDFVNLGATPPDKLQEVAKAGIAKGFSLIMKQLSKGGGPSKITAGLREEFQKKYGNVTDEELGRLVKEDVSRRRLQAKQQQQVKKSDGEEDVSIDDVDVSSMVGMMEMISKQNRDIFQLPSYMLYILRAFTTLEGIGLTVNPQYSILNECYPYLAKRLLTDVHPRSQQALRQMMLPNGKLRIDKWLEFSQGFQQYAAAISATHHTTNVNHNNHNNTDNVNVHNNYLLNNNYTNTLMDNEPVSETQQHSATQKVAYKRPPGIRPQLSNTKSDSLTELLFTQKQNNMQDLMVETAATITDSFFRFSVNQFKESLPGQVLQFLVRAPKTLVDVVVPPELKPYILPFFLPAFLPYELTQAMLKLTQATENDLSNMQSLKILLKELEPGLKLKMTQTIRELVAMKPPTKTQGHSRDTADPSNTFVVPLSARDSSVVRRVLGVTASVPVFLRMSRKFGASVLATAAQRMEQATHKTQLDEGNVRDTGGDTEEEDYEIELFFTEQLGALTSATAKTIARVINTDAVTMKFTNHNDRYNNNRHPLKKNEPQQQRPSLKNNDKK